jgi:hypothetical protein
VAATGENQWPLPGSPVTVYGEDLMAADSAVAGRAYGHDVGAVRVSGKCLPEPLAAALAVATFPHLRTQVVGVRSRLPGSVASLTVRAPG